VSASADQITELRLMCGLAEGDAVYTTAYLTGKIEDHPLLDARGEEAWSYDASTTPPTREANEAWIPTYDLHAAAAEIWDQKAAALAATAMDFDADGASFSRNQLYENALKQARYHRARRTPTSMTLHKHPNESRASDFVWIGNLPEGD
jgi:hypothetical protein